MKDKHTHHEHNHEGCSCGHHHEEHEHEHGHEGCGCGHHHEEHNHHEQVHKETEDKFAHVSNNVQQKVYIVENLGCANCAAKMEKKINELPEVEAATLTFATKQLRVASNHQETLLPILQEICSSIESEVIVRPKEENKEAEFTFEYEGDDMPDSYKLYFIDSITNGFRAVAPMINVNN